MLVNADAKGLEVVGAAYLSRDPVLLSEVRDGVDLHARNMEVLKLPERRIAKFFIFRIIYGGTEDGFASDAMFADVSTDKGYWRELIDEFYRKYSGLKRWHDNLVTEVMSTGVIVVPSGRVFPFKKQWNKWPRTQILNYPVQGFSADLMVLARVLFARKLHDSGAVCDLVCTVHDSIVVDCRPDVVGAVVGLVKETWEELPAFFERCFGVALDVPMTVEVQVGPNWKDMEDA
jgi:DNA polymerase I-like protein with 3'-5' exonuclease and polymerase domains